MPEAVQAFSLPHVEKARIFFHGATETPSAADKAARVVRAGGQPPARSDLAMVETDTPEIAESLSHVRPAFNRTCRNVRLFFISGNVDMSHDMSTNI